MSARWTIVAIGAAPPILPKARQLAPRCPVGASG